MKKYLTYKEIKERKKKKEKDYYKHYSFGIFLLIFYIQIIWLKEW